MNYKQQLAVAGSLFGTGMTMVSMWKAGIYYVEPGHRAFKFNKFYGVQETVYREGWHFKIPYFERQIIFDVRTHPKEIKSITGSKDL